MKKVEVNWENTFRFEFRTRIGEKSNITPFMVEHKMFPGRIIEAYVNMDKCNHGWSGGRSLEIHVSVLDKTSDVVIVDEFEMTQGQFCKVMSNIYNDSISKKWEMITE